MERARNRADFCPTGVVALLEARLLIAWCRAVSSPPRSAKCCRRLLALRPRRAATAFSVGGGVSSYTACSTARWRRKNRCWRSPARAGHNLPTQLWIMIPGAGGRDRSALTDALQGAEAGPPAGRAPGVCAAGHAAAPRP